MALSHMMSFCLLQFEKIHSLLSLSQLFIFFLLLLPHAQSISFNFNSFQQNMNDAITFQGDAFTSQGVLELTKNQRVGSISYSVGRASYAEPVRLWDASTGRLTGFTTHFSFIIKAVNISWHGDGLSFFIAPFESNIPNNSSGGYLALFSAESANKTSQNQIVAVEFDSFKNDWDPSDDHVGIKVNSILSATNVSWNSSIRDGSQANAWISYNSTTKNLSVFLTYANNPVFGGNYSLSYTIDLRSVLPEWVRIGFSAATGNWVELHTIQSWSFYSSLETKDRNKKNKLWLWIGIIVGFGVLRARLVDCNNDYLGIGMDITRNARCCNIIIIPIQLFGNPIVIEP